MTGAEALDQVVWSPGVRRGVLVVEGNEGPPGPQGSPGDDSLHEFHHAANDDEQTIASGVTVERMELVTPALPAGVYRISGSYTYRVNSTGSIYTQVQILDALMIHQMFATGLLPTAGSRPGSFQYHAVVPDDTVLDIDMDVTAGGLFGTATMLESRISVERVGA